MVEKNANLTALRDTLDTSLNQMTSDLKGSKVGMLIILFIDLRTYRPIEMSILKEFAAKQEALLKAAKYVNTS